MKRKNELVTQAARDAARQVTLNGPIQNYMRNLTDAQPGREELPGHFTGVIIRDGKITDVVASNGAVKIED